MYRRPRLNEKEVEDLDFETNSCLYDVTIVDGKVVEVYEQGKGYGGVETRYTWHHIKEGVLSGRHFLDLHPGDGGYSEIELSNAQPVIRFLFTSNLKIVRLNICLRRARTKIGHLLKREKD